MNHPSGRYAFAAALIASGLLTLGACDPCSGLASCASGKYLSVSGQIVDAESRRGVDGVRIDAIRTGGIAVARDSLSTVTRGGGYWRIEFSPETAGAVDADFIVSPPNVPAYRLRGVHLVTREHGGDATLNERWVTVLYFNHFLEVFTGGAANLFVNNAQVTFTRTGGVDLYGPGVATGAYHGTTDFGGRMPLFPPVGGNAVYTLDDNPVVGDLTVTASGFGTTVFHDVTLEPSHLYEDVGAIERYEITRSTSP